MKTLSTKSKGFRLIKKILLLGCILFVFGLIEAFVILRIWIKSDLNSVCNDAMSQYAGDRVTALVSVLTSDDRRLRDKNEAIWALEYVGDERALPVLKGLQTHNGICNHRRIVCQRGLKRAIDNIEGKRFSMMTFK